MRLIVTVAAVALLSGCASPVAPGTAPSLEPTTAPVDLVDVARPAQVFGGDCAAIFSDAAISAALGQTLTAPEYPADWRPLLDPEANLAEQVGGIHCEWSEPSPSPDSVLSPELSLIALPASSVTAAEDTECSPSMIGENGCPIDVTANGIRLSGYIANTVDGADRLARVAAVEALFTASANASAGPPTVTHETRAWATPSDCSDIADSVDLTQIFGVTEPLKSDDSLGTDAYASVVELDLRGGRNLYTCFLYSGTSPGLTFSLLGGGAWIRDDVLAQAGATVIEVPGLEYVIETPDPGVGGTAVDVFDGVNWLHARVEDPETTYPALVALVAALNAA